MVNVLRPDGSIAPIGPVFIRSKTGHPYEYEIASGKSIRLPTGKYLVASSSPFVSNALLKETLELTVEDGKEVVHACRLAYDLIPLRLDLQDDAGLSINSATIRLYGIEHNEQAHFAFGLSDYTFWVPSGTLRIEVFVSGYAKKELRASIPGVSGDPIVIRGVLSRL